LNDPWIQRLPLVFVLLVLHALLPQVVLGQGESAGEYEVKAAMLYNLTRFVEWPTAAYGDAQSPTVMCILGQDPFGGSLTSIVSEQMGKGGRAVEIRRIRNDKGIRGCHVVYISSSERKNIAQIISNLKGSSALTVGEMAQFAARGGMVQFSLEEKQVRFEINLDAVSRADLKISSRLLMLARIVKDQNNNPGREGSALRTERFEIAGSPPPAGYNGLEQDCQQVAIGHNPGDERRRSK
jgi:hypothetical protein